MSQVAKRYAEALFQVAQSQNALAEVSADLKELAKAFETTPELVSLLQAPKISSEKKKAMVIKSKAQKVYTMTNSIELFFL